MFLKRKENGGYPVNHETSSKKLHCDIQVMSSGGGGEILSSRSVRMPFKNIFPQHIQKDLNVISPC